MIRNKTYMIKVCGMKHPDNIKQVLQLGVDFIGFIFHEPSSRFTQTSISSISFNNTKKVGVFVNKSINEILKISAKFGLDYLQLHGQESPTFCKTLKDKGFSIIKVFSINDSFDFETCKPYLKVSDLFIFDTKGKLPGGNGYKFNWDKLKSYNLDHPFLLSGGLKPNSISDLANFKHKKCVGLDLNSGFEIEPALKDIKKLKDFKDEL